MSPRHTLPLLLVSAALAITACGSDGADSPEVRPFAEVQETEFAFENDPDVPGRGIFRVVTTEPMICAIVWGETEALGRFNNSLDMNGTGIEDHNVLLPGAEPGATYYFRVQGSTADGTLYQTELATFTLPAATAADGGGPTPVATGPDLRDLARVVEASSEFSAAWAASHVLDGDLATEWSSAGDGDDAYIVIDLGAPQEVAAFEFVTRSMANGTARTLTYWVVVDDIRYGPFEAGTPADPALILERLSTQQLRFEVERSTGGNTGAMEIRIYGPAE